MLIRACIHKPKICHQSMVHLTSITTYSLFWFLLFVSNVFSLSTYVVDVDIALYHSIVPMFQYIFIIVKVRQSTSITLDIFSAIIEICWLSLQSKSRRRGSTYYLAQTTGTYLTNEITSLFSNAVIQNLISHISYIFLESIDQNFD